MKNFIEIVSGYKKLRKKTFLINARDYDVSQSIEIAFNSFDFSKLL